MDIEVHDTVTAFGYPNEYSQVILNVLNNAKDVLTERMVPAPRIRIRAFAQEGRSVVTIGDNGGGIDEDIIPKIFDPYFSTKEVGKGTGIGLYMSKVIIEQNMGGSLTARNFDEGAEFRIELPSHTESGRNI
jgi:signal transduction histidine kinase